MELVLVLVLEELDDEERQSEHHGAKEVPDRSLLRSGLRRADGHGHRETAADEHYRVEAAEPDVELEAAFRPGMRVPDAINQVCRQEPAEEHDFGDEKEPHSEGGGLELLLHRLEVVLVRRMMRVAAAVRVGVSGNPVRQL